MHTGQRFFFQVLLEARSAFYLSCHPQVLSGRASPQWKIFPHSNLPQSIKGWMNNFNKELWKFNGRAHTTFNFEGHLQWCIQMWIFGASIYYHSLYPKLSILNSWYIIIQLSSYHSGYYGEGQNQYSLLGIKHSEIFLLFLLKSNF